MGFVDDASQLFDKGMSAAKSAVSNVACEQLGFVRSFCNLCQEGWQLGFHERNGGNASYRLTPDDITAADSFFYTNPSSWMSLPIETPEMAGQYLLVTAAGCHFKNIKGAPAVNVGIVQLDGGGAAWRTVWGFRDGGRPTSELGAHVAAQGMRKLATAGASRVVYHAHPASLVALTALLPSDAKTLTNVLWRSLTESVIAFPEGVGALPWMVPGSQALAEATAEQLSTYAACIWQLHGVLATGESADLALGLVHSLEKAAAVYLAARAAAGGNTDALATLSNEDLLAIAEAYDLPLNKALL